MKVLFILFGVVGLCLGQVVPEPKDDGGPVIPQPRKTVPEIQKSFFHPRQILAQPKQTRSCTTRTQLATGQQVQIKSPNSPNVYPNNVDTMTCFSSPAGTTMTITCNPFDLESQQDCAFDKLSVSISGDENLSDERKFCGTTFAPQTSTANSLVVAFHSDHSVQRSGYTCTITVLAKTCTTTTKLTQVGQQVQITSPNYPSVYPNNVDTVNCFSSPAGTRMTIACNPFNLEHQDTCAFDKLTVSASGDLSLRDGRGFCGTTFTPVTSNSNQMTVAFKTDASVQNPGYKCFITSVASGTGSSTSAPNPQQSTTRAPGQSSTGAPAPGQTSTGSPAAAQNSTQNPGSCQCGGRNVASRIVNGTPAKPNEFPWRCYLRTTSYDFFCGCSEICHESSPNWIMTARHCTAAVEGQRLSVVVGAHIRSTASRNQRTYAVDRIENHAQYNSSSMDNDMSLLHVSTPISFSTDVSPVCLPWNMASTNFSGTTVTASGWGTTSSGGSVSDTLMEVDLPVLTTEQCSQYYPGSITNNMICTYQPGKDTCQGDSGGSIDYNDPSTNRYYGIGVVSWGIGCAGQRRPGVYAKVTNYLSWITSKTQGETFCRA